MRALTRPSAVHLVGGEVVHVTSAKPVALRIWDEACPMVEATLPDGSTRHILRSAITSYEGPLDVDRADSERMWD